MQGLVAHNSIRELHRCALLVKLAIHHSFYLFHLLQAKGVVLYWYHLRWVTCVCLQIVANFLSFRSTNVSLIRIFLLFLLVLCFLLVLLLASLHWFWDLFQAILRVPALVSSLIAYRTLDVTSVPNCSQAACFVLLHYRVNL